jgi:hypothetical protein
MTAASSTLTRRLRILLSEVLPPYPYLQDTPRRGWRRNGACRAEKPSRRRPNKNPPCRIVTVSYMTRLGRREVPSTQPQLAGAPEISLDTALPSAWQPPIGRCSTELHASRVPQERRVARYRWADACSTSFVILALLQSAAQWLARRARIMRPARLPSQEHNLTSRS